MAKSRSRIGRASRYKGGEGQREAAAYLNTILPPGYTAENAARNGVRGGEDVVIYRKLPDTVNANGQDAARYREPLAISIEVKRDAHVRLGTKALDDACDQARSRNALWLVLWRGDREDWRVTTPDAKGLLGTYTGEGRHRHVLARMIEAVDAARRGAV